EDVGGQMWRGFPCTVPFAIRNVVVLAAERREGRNAVLDEPRPGIVVCNDGIEKVADYVRRKMLACKRPSQSRRMVLATFAAG
ncbi:MAG: hypothetical protein ACJ8LM_00690, partial [Candidatus Udaeobacter sp.]